MQFRFFIIISLILALAFPSCNKGEWKPGRPLAKENIRVGVVHMTNPFSESSGYAYAHQMGIEKMQRNLALKDGQVLYKTHVDDSNPLYAESAIRELIAQGANIIVATSWGYMDSCEKLAAEFPSVVFAHAAGYKYNDRNFTNYFGRVYQARYLSGLIAGAQTRSGKIGYVAAWGTENSEVTGGINAFAMGVEKVNPQASIYVRVTHSWFDPMGEAAAARALIGEGCDVIAQHCDTANPQTEAERAGVWGIGYNTNMIADAPSSTLTSVLWNWDAYYTMLVQSVINGTFITAPWFGSLKDGIVGISPLNETINWDAQTLRVLEEEQRRLESGDFDVFSLTDDEIRNGIDWYYHTVIEL